MIYFSFFCNLLNLFDLDFFEWHWLNLSYVFDDVKVRQRKASRKVSLFISGVLPIQRLPYFSSSFLLNLLPFWKFNLICFYGFSKYVSSVSGMYKIVRPAIGESLRYWEKVVIRFSAFSNRTSLYFFLFYFLNYLFLFFSHSCTGKCLSPSYETNIGKHHL